MKATMKCRKCTCYAEHYTYPILTAKIKNPHAITAQIPHSGARNLNHFLYGIWQIASAAINSPLVGVMTFVNASPNWNASTEVCLDIPSRSDNGAINGIVIAACPDPDGTRKFRRSCSTNIPQALTFADNPCNTLPIA